MRILDPLLFLTGHRGAIERIAATRHAWIVGAILVLSAGIARNYDHLDLLRNPEWFIGPFAASLVSIVFIFLWISGPLKLEKAGNWPKQLGTFLTLAWMTAPCAWLYGIPAESMTGIVTATKWNIAFLAVVSLWRVAIVTRAVAVLTEVKAIRALPLILAPAALEMLVGSFFKRLSLIGVMGGVRLPPHTELLQKASGFATVASFWTFLAAVVCCLITRGIATAPLYRPTTKLPASWAAMAVAATGLWALAAVPYHRTIVHRDQLLALIQSKNYPAAVAFASARTRADFPTHHYLPPEPDGWLFPMEILDALSTDTPDWLRHEWTSNAVESLSLNLPRNKEAWKEITVHYPTVSAAVATRAEELRRAGPSHAKEIYWLKDFDRLTAPEPPPDRFDPSQLPLPSK
jgi:hypothetical protein